MMNTLVLLMLISFGAQADYVGFSHGNEFETAAIEGQVTVSCNGFNGTGSAIFACRDVVLDPQPYDAFVGPRNARAVQVELRVTQENGTKRSRSDEYNGSAGRSVDAFNLWISTLFQKPLLAIGNNKVEYSVYKDSRRTEELAHGVFSARVFRGPARRCATAHYNSTDINDCNSQYSICQRFFQEFNNCK